MKINLSFKALSSESYLIFCSMKPQILISFYLTQLHQTHHVQHKRVVINYLWLKIINGEESQKIIITGHISDEINHMSALNWRRGPGWLAVSHNFHYFMIFFTCRLTSLRPVTPVDICIRKKINKVPFN